MRAVVVYESMYGNTRAIAEAIGEGLRATPPITDVTVVPVTAADPAFTRRVDLLVAGGPTHVHSMSRPNTRRAAVEVAHEPNSGLTLEPSAEDLGVREWLGDIPACAARGAAFDTRVDSPAWLTGRASKRIAHELSERGCTMVVEPESFLVTKDSVLLAGELTRAREWGAGVAGALVPASEKALAGGPTA